MTIEQADANARVRWPVTGTSDQLEAVAPWLPGGFSWSAAGATVSSNATQYEALLPMKGTNRLLRVCREWP